MAAKLDKTNTPGIYKRGGRYVVVTTYRGQQHKSFHRTLAEAREAKGDRTRSGASKRPRSRVPFDEHARAWAASCQGRTARGLDDDTRESYRVALERHAIPHFRSTPLRDIEPDDIRQFGAKLQAAGLCAATVSKYMAPVKALFADALGDGSLAANPTTGVRIVARRGQDTPERAEKAMSRVELAAVLAEIPDRWRLLFELLAHTGARVSELLGLDWSDVEFGERPRLRISRQWYRGKLKAPKTAAGVRTIDIAPEVASLLWDAGAGARRRLPCCWPRSTVSCERRCRSATGRRSPTRSSPPPASSHCSARTPPPGPRPRRDDGARGCASRPAERAGRIRLTSRVDEHHRREPRRHRAASDRVGPRAARRR